MNAHSRYRTYSFYCTSILLIVAVAFLLRVVIVPLIVALVIAYILNPAVEALERKGVRRSILAFCLIAIGIILVTLFSWILVPLIIDQLDTILKSLPEFKNNFDKTLVPQIETFLKEKLQLQAEIKLQWSDYFNSIISKPAEFIIQGFQGSTRFIIGSLLIIVMTPIFTFFLVRDLRTLRDSLFTLVPLDLRSKLTSFLHDLNVTLMAVLRGQLSLVLIMSVLYSSGFAFVGLPAGIVVGLLTGFARLIPYLDVIVGGTLSAIVILANSSPSSVSFGILTVFFVCQALDAFLITPKIMGQASGLHPLIIIVSILCFGDWFGFYGVLIAIPVAAVARVTLKMLSDHYLNSQFYFNRN